MPSRKKRFHSAALTLLLACSFAAFAADNVPKASDYRPIAAEEGRRAGEYQRRAEVVKRAGELFTLFGGEMALQKGDAATALASYMLTFTRTKDPAAAERAMEMALTLRAYEQADAIYQQWREVEPTPGAAQERMGWVRDLTLKKFDAVEKNFNRVMENADAESKRKLFLQLSQAAVEHPGFAKRIDRKVQRETRKYQDMPEAVMTNAIFSAMANEQRDTVRALQRLAELDASIVPTTMFTLRLIGQRQPEILNKFFAETDTKKLSPMWRELQVEGLVYAGKYEEAYNLLQELLKEEPDADLYIQAALLAVNQKAELPVVMSYLEQAYKNGTQEQRSRAAVLAAMRSVDAKNFRAAREWSGRIKSPAYVFDKAVLLASIEAESGSWKKAVEYVQAARKLPEQQGSFFGDADLMRIQLFALSKHENPRVALQELNTLMRKTEARQDSREKLADVLYQRAMVYADSLNEPDKAVADLRRYNELRPNSPEGMNALGYTMLTMQGGNVEEAFKLVQSAYSLEPESAAINDSLGWAYFLKGDAESALPYLQYAFDKQQDAEVAAHLGEAYWKLGKQDKAKEVFKKGLAVKEGKRSLLLQTIKRLGISLPGVK